MSVSSSRLSVAAVGSGIGGLAVSWLLQKRHRVTLDEKDERLGGHCITVDVHDAAGNRLAMDAGFIVDNAHNYPNLVALSRHLGVATQESAMSPAVSFDHRRLEYSGTDLKGPFAQKRDLSRPMYLVILRDISRFCRAAPGFVAGAGARAWAPQR